MSKEVDYSIIRYSNCWEDTDILLEGLDIRKGDTGLSVASGGDNTLSMLTREPKTIYAFDLNPRQLYCLELKMACFRMLSYRQTLAFLGVTPCADRLAVYKKLCPHLSAEAQDYFDCNMDIILRGIIHAGRFENFFRIFRKHIIPLFSTIERYREFAKLDDVGQQIAYFNHYIYNNRMKLMFKLYFGSKVMGSLGRDRSFYKYVEDEKSSADDIRERFRFGISNTVNRTNPYVNYIVYGNYGRECLPHYLRRENFDIIKRNIDRIVLVNSDLISIKDVKFDFFNLSDIFEYMSGQEFEENTEHLRSISADGARIAYWNMQNKRYITENGFEADRPLSDELFRQNRSWFYRDFLIYRRTDRN